MPAEGRALWSLFCELSSRRRAGAAGPSPIGWDDFVNYERVRHRTLLPWQIDAVIALDRIYAEVCDDQAEAARPQSQGSGSPIDEGRGWPR